MSGLLDIPLGRFVSISGTAEAGAGEQNRWGQIKAKMGLSEGRSLWSAPLDVKEEG